jgi:dihydropyrimidinase
MRTLLTGERIVTPEGEGPCRILVEDGRILAMGPELPPPRGEYLDLRAGDLVVMPGGVDVHTHLELTVGGARTADDWASGSRAALWGGTTTVVDFTAPGEEGSLWADLQSALSLVGRRSLVDAGLHVTVTAAALGRLDELETVARAGQTTLKVYTAYPGLMLEPDGLLRVFERAAALGMRVWVHCEDWPEIDRRLGEARAAGDTRAIMHARTRPPETEVEAVRGVLALGERTGASLHLAHLSTLGAARLVAKAKARGLPVSAETCPHYLWLEEHRLSWPAQEALCHICAPPLRQAPHLDALWQALADGTIEAVATDHCPFSWEGGKDRGLSGGQEDFTKTPGGLPGVETRFPLVFAGGVVGGRFDLRRFVELVASGPARLAGLYPQKGALVQGADADLVLFDPEGITRLGAASLHSQMDHSPYEGLRVAGRVVGVMKAGTLVMANGEWLEDPPCGRVLERSAVDGRP